MKTKRLVALVYSSQQKASEVNATRRTDEADPDDDKPPDGLSEYDTEATILALERALARKYKVIPIEGDVMALARLDALRPDFVFNISEGFSGANRESHIPIICEMLDLPCLGSDALTLGICLDKARTKEILKANGIPTPNFVITDGNSSLAALSGFPLPAIVKPLREGSSMGITDSSLAKTADELVVLAGNVRRRYSQPAIVEEFLPGREFTVGILGNEPEWEILPAIEINHAALPTGANPIYGYEAKWVWDDPANPLPIHICPADIDEPLAAGIRALALRVARVMRLRDWCRMDIRLDAGGNPQIIELNPLPGVLPDPRDNSALPAAARAAGYGYDELILRVAEIAIKRCGIG